MKIRLIAPAIALALLAVGCSSGDDAVADPITAATTTTAPAPAPAQTAPKPTRTPTPEPSESEIPRYLAGETTTFAGVTLTINSVEVSQEISTTQGGPIVAADGEQLVLVRTHFVNSDSGLVDLSCAGATNVYIQGWDAEGREMAPIFETSRIEGNPECNSHLLQGQEHDWNFAYRAIAGSSPVGISLIDTNGYSDAIYMLFPGME